jgi:hypothetical protein
MTEELIDRTVREWVGAHPVRGARTLDRLNHSIFHAGQRSTEEVTEALIQMVGRMKVAQSRIW